MAVQMRALLIAFLVLAFMTAAVTSFLYGWYLRELTSERRGSRKR